MRVAGSKFGNGLFPRAAGLLHDLIYGVSDHGGVGVSRADCIDGNAFPRSLECRGTGQTDDAMFGGTVR